MSEINGINISPEEDGDNFENQIELGYKLMRDAVKCSCQLPVDDVRKNIDIIDPNATKRLSSILNKSLAIATDILQHENVKHNITHNNAVEKLNIIVEANDKLLDRAKDHMNSLNISRLKPPPDPRNEENVKKFKTASVGSWNKDLKKSVIWKERILNVTRPIKHLFEKHTNEKPQIKFTDKIDNSSTPFIPRITVKPNALVPLSRTKETALDGSCGYANPYAYEMDHFNVPESQLTKGNSYRPKTFDETAYMYVDDLTKLNTMISHLEGEHEIAVDLEHHNYRTFQGFTCLMQISSRTEDFIIDTIQLRDHMHLLNKIFTDPNILKVFHGADSDVLWLQRDFGLYVVNMFDTYQASVMLNFSRLSLMYLLNEYCQVESDKRYQLYDWRIRPLASEALTYARGDTHYLLYIYDVLRNKLIDTANGNTNLLKAVYSQSTGICKQRYEKDLFSDNNHLEIYKMSRRTFDNRQMVALKEIYQWRDKIARADDESTHYVLPNHMLLQIADSLPREAQGILACCNPIPPLVKKHLLDIHQIVFKARGVPLIKHVLEAQKSRTFVMQGSVLSKAPCPHDLTHNADFRDNLPTLLDGTDKLMTDDMFDKIVEPKMFGAHSTENNFVDSTDVNVENVFKKISDSPYQRYKMTILSLQTNKVNTTATDNFENTTNTNLNEEGNQETKSDVNLSAVTSNQEKDLPIKTEVDMDGLNDLPAATIDPKVEPEEISIAEKLSREKTENVILYKKPATKRNSTERILSAKSNNNKDVSRVKRFKFCESGSGDNLSQPNTSKKQNSQTTSFDYSKVDFKKFVSNPGTISKKLQHLKIQIQKNVMNKKAANRKK